MACESISRALRILYCGRPDRRPGLRAKRLPNPGVEIHVSKPDHSPVAHRSFPGNWLLQRRVQRSFRRRAGGFKVQMPGTPKEQMSMRAECRRSRFPPRIDGAYVVSYADMPIPGNESPAMVQHRLDGSRDGQLANMGGKLVSESKIQLGGKYPGRDIRADIPGKKMYAHTQIFIVDNRLYQLWPLAGSPGWTLRKRRSSSTPLL